MSEQVRRLNLDPMGLPILVSEARSNGIAALVITSCNQFSALWPEVEALTNQGLAA